MASKSQLENAIEQIQEKAPDVERDFTQVALPNGDTVSTLERVCKEVCGSTLRLIHALTIVSGTGAGDVHTD